MYRLKLPPVFASVTTGSTQESPRNRIMVRLLHVHKILSGSFTCPVKPIALPVVVKPATVRPGFVPAAV